jgi:adenylosuccinate lyase
VMLALIRKSKMTREDAYAIVQKSAMKVFHDGDNFIELLKNDNKIKEVLTIEELESCFDLDAHFKNIENIFNRVFDN